MHSAVEEAPKQRLPGRVRDVGDNSEAASSYRPLDDRELQVLVEVGYQRREVRDQRVVVECGEERRADKEWKLREARENRLDPPTLQSAVNHQPREEEPDKQRRLEVRQRRIGCGCTVEAEEI